MPPENTIAPEITTPVRSRALTIRSILASVVVGLFILCRLPHSKSSLWPSGPQQSQTLSAIEEPRGGPDNERGPLTRQHAEHRRHGDRWINVSAAQVDARTGCGGDTDHEIAGCGRNLEGKLHALIHGDHLERARPNPQKFGNHAGTQHQSEPCFEAVHLVVPQPFIGCLSAFQLQSFGERIWWKRRV
jgi:hypothetical protein